MGTAGKKCLSAHFKSSLATSAFSALSDATSPTLLAWRVFDFKLDACQRRMLYS